MTAAQKKKSLVLVRPEDRFDRLTFDPRMEILERAAHFGHYTCPDCGSAVRFQFKDFLKHSDSAFNASDLRRFNARMPLSSSTCTQKALDFYCPGCRRPVRIVDKALEFAMGSHAFTITQVVESNHK